jgi:hypothetical protein
MSPKVTNLIAAGKASFASDTRRSLRVLRDAVSVAFAMVWFDSFRVGKLKQQNGGCRKTLPAAIKCIAFSEFEDFLDILLY